MGLDSCQHPQLAPAPESATHGGPGGRTRCTSAKSRKAVRQCLGASGSRRRLARARRCATARGLPEQGLCRTRGASSASPAVEAHDGLHSRRPLLSRLAVEMLPCPLVPRPLCGEHASAPRAGGSGDSGISARPRFQRAIRRVVWVRAARVSWGATSWAGVCRSPHPRDGCAARRGAAGAGGARTPP